MLKETTVAELAKRAGISTGDLLKAIKSEVEESLTFETDGEFITHTELDSIKERAGKDSYKEGKKAGEEMLIKDIKNDEGLDIEGKTKDQLIRALKEKYTKEAGSEPTKRITELENDNKKLRDLATESETKLKTETEKFTTQLNRIEIEAAIKNNLPDKLANGLSKEDAFILYKAKREFNKTDAGIELIDPATKQTMKDKKLVPISVSEDIKSFVESFGSISGNGRGAGDEGHKQKTNFESFTKRTEVESYFEKNGTPISEQSAILAKAMKNEGFKINE
jgi:hypothetical protein